MRTILFVAAAAVLLAGCDTGEGWVPGDDGRYAHALPEAPRPNPAAPAQLAAAPRAPVVMVPQTPPDAEPAAAVAPAPPVPLVNTHCQGVARQRAADARANGYSFEMEDLIYAGTYKDCVQWDSRHAH